MQTRTLRGSFGKRVAMAFGVLALALTLAFGVGGDAAAWRGTWYGPTTGAGGTPVHAAGTHRQATPPALYGGGAMATRQ